MTNTAMLKDKIASSGLKSKKIAEIMGITAVSLSKKTHNVTEFKASEIESLSQILRLSVKDKNEIFFAHNVDFKSTAT